MSLNYFNFDLGLKKEFCSNTTENIPLYDFPLISLGLFILIYWPDHYISIALYGYMGYFKESNKNTAIWSRLQVFGPKILQIGEFYGP